MARYNVAVIGEAVLHYRIVDQLGSGGMGVVYRAYDTKLEREVALKFLTGTSLGDNDVKERFLREARAAAALDHPNICGVFEIGEESDRLFMAMPLLEGESLDKRIASGPRPIPEIVAIAVQTAEGLEEAHSKEIVHRDIKPANIMVRERGGSRLQAVLMDFGLARLSQATKLTCEGSQLGTAAYMSPEQTQGAPVDHRTDIWALGVVIYEMVVGQLPFAAEYEQALFYGILNEQPEPITSLRTGVPMELERIVGKCLAKEAGERYQSITELIVDLNALKRVSSATAVRSRVRSPPSEPVAEQMPLAQKEQRFSAMQLATGSLGLAALAAALTWAVTADEPTAALHSRYDMRRLTWDAGLNAFPALSADGSLIAYASDRSGRGDTDIWVQQINGGSTIRVTDHEADELLPSFSPDGSKIVFVRIDKDDTGAYVTPALGGDSQLLARMAFWPAFSPDGSKIAFVRLGEVFVMPAGGGEETPLAPGYSSPLGGAVWSPTSKHVIFRGQDPEGETDWFAAAVDSDGVKRLKIAKLLAEDYNFQIIESESWCWGPNGILLDSARNIVELPIDPESFEITGPPDDLTYGSGFELHPTASLDGRVAFMSSQGQKNVWSLDLNQPEAEPYRLTHSDAEDLAPDVSHDGRRMTYLSNRWGHVDVWTRDFETGVEHNLTNDDAVENMPSISPDGRRVVYRVFRDEDRSVRVRPFDGGPAREICRDCGRPTGWSSDGNLILLQKNEPGKRLGAFVVSANGGEPAMILQTERGDVWEPQFSPDGNWVSFMVQPDPLRGHVLVAPFRGREEVPESEWIEITSDDNGDNNPTWSPDGRSIYFTSTRAGSMDLWVQPVDTSTKRPQGERQLLHRFPMLSKSMHTMPGADRSLAAAEDKLVFPLIEMAGSIFLMEPLER